ncbi:Prefoldin subunit 3 [Lactarius akahatsu]|uniref:Prefoldin subunit 3 n=1 Tax=Lactarius akahatsu TaxID=416441 RepID=A0AAD4QBA2_9AGAM|nr:Prefoldin subunit 3 [Lactarius akahatsu]
MSASTTPANIIQQDEKNPRGIPKALFIVRLSAYASPAHRHFTFLQNDVEEYVGGPDAAVERVLAAFQDVLAKYRYMDSNLTQRRRGLEEKIPEIKKTLSMVEFLRDRREGKKASTEGDVDDADDDLEDDLEGEKGGDERIRTTFELADTLYAEAELEETDTVFLWLGANVMLSYKIPAAIELLKSKLEAANTSLSNTIEDLEFIREQMTVMEVNTARVYNWDVKRRRERKEKERVAEAVET